MKSIKEIHNTIKGNKMYNHYSSLLNITKNVDGIFSGKTIAVKDNI